MAGNRKKISIDLTQGPLGMGSSGAPMIQAHGTNYPLSTETNNPAPPGIVRTIDLTKREPLGNNIPMITPSGSRLVRVRYT